MRILVIGHSVLDIIHEGDKKTIKPGGIYYTVNCLNHIVSPEDELTLCTCKEEKYFDYFSEAFKRWNVVSGSTDSIPKVNLHITFGSERVEHYESINSSLEVPFDLLDKTDAVLINMITGFDITLEMLQEIRHRFKGLIYMDVHTLSRGVGPHMHRYFRRIADFHKWKENLTIIQVNEHEVLTLSDEKDEKSVAEDILKVGTGMPEQLIVTKGSLGATVYYKEEKEILSYYTPAHNTTAVNTIGLGDTFGAVYFYTYFKTKSLINSLNLASLAGSYAASESGFDKLSDIRNVLNRHN